MRWHIGQRLPPQSQRHYETYGGHHMQWHTDNKTDKGFAPIPGIIFIVYLEDITDGEFQYCRSHTFSGTKSYNDYSDAWIEENCAKDIVSFKAPKGTIVIYDTYGIHRAKPVADKLFVRKSLFFQVDADCHSAEPIRQLLIKNMDNKIAKYLGFRPAAEYRVFPYTMIENLPLKRVALSIPKWILYRMIRGFYELFSLETKARIRERLIIL